jgi:hypothetical protein
MSVDRVAGAIDNGWLGLISGDVFDNFTSNRWLIDRICKVEANRAKVVDWARI